MRNISWLSTARAGSAYLAGLGSRGWMEYLSCVGDVFAALLVWGDFIRTNIVMGFVPVGGEPRKSFLGAECTRRLASKNVTETLCQYHMCTSLVALSLPCHRPIDTSNRSYSSQSLEL